MSRLFLYGLPATCSKSFVHAGKKCNAGELFPYDTLGLSEHEVKGLWLADHIEFPDPLAKRSQQGKSQHAR